jgi:hypothetical protein
MTAYKLLVIISYLLRSCFAPTNIFGKPRCTRCLVARSRIAELIALLYFRVCVTIEERSINPTDEQAQACLRVCQMLSNYYKDIQLFRFNPRSREVYIFAGEELQIRIFFSGDWSFINETEL